MQKLSFGSFALVFLMLLTLLSTGPAASAAPGGGYADIVEVTDKLEVSNGSLREDITTTYASYVNSTCSPEILAIWETALASGSHAVTQRDSRFSGNDEVAIKFLPNRNTSIEFDLAGDGDHAVKSASGGSMPFYVVQISLTASGVVSAYCVYANDSLWVAAHQNYYDYNIVKPLLSTFPINYPTGYTGQSIPAEFVPPAPTYVAMGDSFSSGEGNAPYELDTDESGVNQCHRSPLAYPRLLQNDPTLSLGTTAFIACSGATTDNVRFGGTGGGSWNKAPQVDALSGDTELVTITIGGNDVGLKGFITSCMFAACGIGTNAYNDIADKIDGSLFQDKLRVTYLKILTDASTADVYVINYPYIVRDRPNDACNVFPDGLTSNDAAAEVVTTKLNTAILGVYADIKQDSTLSATLKDRLHFVEVNYTGSPFAGHDMCSAQSGDNEYLDNYFHWFDTASPSSPRAFHPNEDGQAAYKSIIKEILS